MKDKIIIIKVGNGYSLTIFPEKLSQLPLPEGWGLQGGGSMKKAQFQPIPKPNQLIWEQKNRKEKQK